MTIAGRTLVEWVEFSRRDDCLDRMVPSDLRVLIGEIYRQRTAATKAIEIIETTLHHQREKVTDAVSILRESIGRD